MRMINFSKFKTLFAGKNRTKFIAILLIAAVVIIFASEMLFTDSEKELVSDGNTFDIDEITENTEARIENLLHSINGVGKVEVMITFEGSVRNKYAVNYGVTEDSNETAAGDTDTHYEKNEEHIIINNGNKEEALKEYYTLPDISGVVVVCEGGGSTAVRERVLSAVTTALNIGSDRVYVTERN